MTRKLQLPATSTEVLIRNESHQVAFDPSNGITLDGNMVFKFGERLTDQAVAYTTIDSPDSLVPLKDLNQLGNFGPDHIMLSTRIMNRRLGRVFDYPPFFVDIVERTNHASPLRAIGFVSSKKVLESWAQSKPEAITKKMDSFTNPTTPTTRTHTKPAESAPEHRPIEQEIDPKVVAQAVADIFLDLPIGTIMTHQELKSRLDSVQIDSSSEVVATVTAFLQRKEIILRASDSPHQSTTASQNTQIVYTRL